MKKFLYAVTMLAATLVSGSVSADSQPYMVRDVEGVPTGSSTPRNFMPLGDRFVFAAATPDLGSGLWISDGTAAGTTQLRRDLFVDQQTTVGYLNGSVYFRAQYPSASTWQIWATDGTPAGTRLILANAPTNNYLPSPFVEFNGRLYFGFASDQSGPHPIWVTDGTAETTSVFFPGAGACAAVLNGRLLFVADDEASGSEFWVSDGTPDGTSQLPEVFPGPRPGVVRMMTAVNGDFYFVGNDGSHGLELWKTDGVGVSLVRDISPGSNGSFTLTASAPPFTTMGNELYFVAGRSDLGRELWRSDGSEAGTNFVIDFRPGSQSGVLNGAIGATQDRVFFQIDNVTDRGIAATDGTAEGTVVVIPHFPGAGLPSIPTTSALALISLESDRDLIRSDGTLDGTFTILDLQASRVTSLGESFAMAVTDAAHGVEPWLSDGSAAGTHLVADVDDVASGNPSNLTDINGQLYFRSNDPVFGGEPFRTRGTPATTHLVADIQPGLASSNPFGFFPIETGAVFSAQGGDGRPWRTDAETGGAVPVESAPVMGLSFAFDGFVYGQTVNNVLWRTDGFSSNQVAGSLYYALSPLGSNLLLGGFAPTTGDAIFVSDGTSPGAAIDLPIGPADFGLPSFIATTTNRVFYFLPDAPSDKIWWTTGTVLGTNPVPGSADIQEVSAPYAVLNGAVYFSARAGNVRSLYAVDGPDSELRLVLPDFHASSLGVLGDRLFIVGSTANFERHVWISDGTAEGTVFVPGVTPQSSSQLVTFDGAIFFVGEDGTHGHELWRSRGDIESTAMVADINAGSASSNPAALTASGDRLYFVANDGVHGFELWALPRNVAGDIDGDADVDLQDLSYLLSNFGTAGPTGDFDADGDVDLQDLGFLLANFGESV